MQSISFNNKCKQHSIIKKLSNSSWTMQLWGEKLQITFSDPYIQLIQWSPNALIQLAWLLVISLQYSFITEGLLHPVFRSYSSVKRPVVWNLDENSGQNQNCRLKLPTAGNILSKYLLNKINPFYCQSEALYTNILNNNWFNARSFKLLQDYPSHKKHFPEYKFS